MKIQALYSKTKKWHDVKNVAKCDDLIEYQLEGIDGKIYHKNIYDLRDSPETKDMPKNIKEISKGEEINDDGSITRFPGKEQLIKPKASEKLSSMNKSIKDKWELLKAKMNHETAFKNMDIFNDADQADQADQAEPDQKPDQPSEQSVNDVNTQDNGNKPDAQQSDEQLRQLPEGAEIQPSANISASEEDENQESMNEEQLIEALKELGYSDPEIAHIVHGHVPKVPGDEEQDYEAHKQNLSQDQEGHSQTIDHRGEEHEVDLEHKKKMQDLDFEYAKREKEIKIQHLEEELALKRAKIKTNASSGAEK
jgi:hypothetical protein